MPIKDMNIGQLEVRSAELRDMLSADNADLIAIEDEIKQIEERKAELKADAQKRAAALAEAVVMQPAQKVEEVRQMPTLTEVRSTNEYAVAYLKAMNGNDTEARALLSTNALSGGQIPVPTLLETEIKTAWEQDDLMSLVGKSYYKGNVKIGFELSATGAVVHAEGSPAPDEEVIEIGTVEIKAENIKKWITVSDEAIEGTTIDTIGYLYREIAHKIVSKACEILVGKIDAAPQVSTSTAPAVMVETASTVAVDTVANAIAKLSGEARNLQIVMNRATKPLFTALALNAGYAIDVFEGLADRIHYSEAVKSFAAASSGETYMIIGDFESGARANFPNGNEITIKIDDLSLAEKDLVKIVGRQFVGMEVIAEKRFVKIVK